MPNNNFILSENQQNEVARFTVHSGHDGTKSGVDEMNIFLNSIIQVCDTTR